MISFPCLEVRMVPAAKVVANEYNPNKVAMPEMDLLAQSILEDGVTQPVVTFFDAETDRYEVVDGFHRYSLLTQRFGCHEIPVVVIDKPLDERMASTIRHNRARGKHQVDLMGALVASLKGLGIDESQIAQRLGMEGEEVLRLSQQVRAASMLAAKTYGRAWEMTDERASETPEEEIDVDA